MERQVRTGLLYDFYGSLLTEKQRQVMELYYQEDWSLAEIAATASSSRQAVHDLLQRSERIMEEYEAKLGLLERYLKDQATLKELAQGLQSIIESLPLGADNTERLIGLKQDIDRLREVETE